MQFETAPWGRRTLALLADWLMSSLVVAAFVGPTAIPFASLALGEDPDPSTNMWVLGVFVLETALFTYLLGGSFGKMLTRLRTVPADGRLRPHNPLRVLGRQVLVALVIPPLVFRADGRGLHDLFARTATVTLQEYQRLLGSAQPR